MHLPECFLLLCLLGAPPGAINPLAAGEGGIGISPGIILIEDAPAGSRLDLGAQGLRIQMSNGSPEEQTFSLAVSSPGPDQIQSYEAGYEPIPDPTWVHLEKTDLIVPAHGMASTGIILDIPDTPEMHNRHFMVYIDGGPVIHQALGAVLRVRARLLLETAIAPQPELPAHGGAWSLSPGRISMQRQADGTWTGEVAVRNTGITAAVYDLLSLDRIYGPGQEDRRSRYFGSQQTAITTESWAHPDVASFSLEPGASRTIHLAGTAKRAPRERESIDEVLFLARRASDTTPPKQRKQISGHDYDRSELIRLRYQLPSTSEPTKP